MRNRIACSCLLWIVASLTPACAPEGDTGSAAVQIRFEIPAQTHGMRGVLSGVVDTIRVTVSADNQQLATSDFDYEGLEGTVSGIRAGSDRIFDVQALSAGQLVYAGRSTGVTITAKSTQAVPVTLTPAYTTDVYAPGQVTDLAALAQGQDVVLSWTAVGDDGLVGQAASYDLRQTEDLTITPSNFSQATAVAVPAAAASAGTAETFTVAGLAANGVYHFALKVVDDDGNTSIMSNEVYVTLGAGDSVPPARILDLSVVEVGETSVTLSWTAPGDDGDMGTVSSYDVRYSTQAIDDTNFDAASQAQGPASPLPAGQTETVTIDALTTGQTYYFAVKAGDEVPNWSLRSGMVSATPDDLVPPVAVTDLVVSDSTDTTVTLAWTAPGDDDDVGQASSYEIRYLPGPSPIDADNFSGATLVANPPPPQTAGSAETVVVSGLSSGTAYTFALISLDNLDNASDLSNVVLATPGQVDDIPPGDVIDLAVSAVTETSIILSFTAPGDDGLLGTVTAYDLRHSASAISDAGIYAAATQIPWPGGTPLVSGGNQQLVEVSGLTAGQTYYFALAAVDDQGNASGLSNSPSGVPADTENPGTVTDLAAPAVGDDFVTLTWTAPGDNGAVGTIDHYEIRYSSALIDAGNFAAATLFGAPPTPLAAGGAQTVDVTGLAASTQYWFALVAVDDVGLVSAMSNVVTGIPGVQDVTAPDAVTDLAVSGATAASVFLTWTAPGDDGASGTVSSYDLRFAAAPIASMPEFNAATQFPWPGATVIVAGGNQQTVELTGLTPGQTWYFALRAMDNSNNNSGLSNSPSGYPDDTPPALVSDLAISDSGDDYITLTWTAPADDNPGGDAAEYGIYYSDQSFSDHLLATEWGTPPTPAAAGNGDTVTISGLTPGGTYFVRLRAADEIPNWSALSNEETITLGCSLCPQIAAARPAAAAAGARIQIDGSQFGASQGGSTLTVGGLPASVLSWSDTLISAVVPAASGPVDLVLTTAAGADTSPFQVTPYIDTLTPGTTTTGASLTLAGSGFGATQGLSAVSFFGSATSPAITSWSDDQIVLTIPADALTGPMTVQVDGLLSNTPLISLTDAGPRAWSATAIIRDATNLSFLGRMASDPQGHVQLVFMETDGANDQIWGLVHEGVSWSSTPTQISVSAAQSVLADVVALGDHSFVTVWEEADASLAASAGYDTTWSAVESASTSNCWMDPALGLLPGGNLIVAWANGPGDGVQYNLRSPAGVWGTSSQAFAASGDTARVAGAVDPAGDFHIVYAEGTEIGHAAFAGGSWQSLGAVASITSVASDVYVDLAADSLGGLHAVWWDNGGYRYSSFDGAAWASPTDIAGAATTSMGFLQLVIDGSDQLHLTVEDDAGGADYDVFYARKMPAGAWSAFWDVSSGDDPGDARFPGLVVTPDMRLHVVWTQDNLSLLGQSWE